VIWSKLPSHKTVNNLLDIPIEGDADEDLLSKIGALVPINLPVVVPASNVAQSSSAGAAEVKQAGVTASPYATTAWKWAQESNKKHVEARVKQARIEKVALDRAQADQAALLAANLEKIMAIGANEERPRNCGSHPGTSGCSATISGEHSGMAPALCSTFWKLLCTYPDASTPLTSTAKWQLRMTIRRRNPCDPRDHGPGRLPRVPDRRRHSL
jgi:hypothetical protein